MSIKSKILLTETVKNTNPRGPNADAEYVIAYVVAADGTSVPALFTDSELAKATRRAAKNPEDVPAAYVEPVVQPEPAKKSWFQKVFKR